MKKVALVLVALLVVPMLLSACGSESPDTAKDYMEAVMKGDVEEAQKFACEDFQDATAELAASVPGVSESNVVRNVDLKFDVGKGNDEEKITVTGSYDIVLLNASGKAVAYSEEAYEVAASVRDKRDVDGDGDDGETMNTRIVLEMQKDGDDWCVMSLEGGYWNPTYSEAESSEGEVSGEGEASSE